MVMWLSKQGSPAENPITGQVTLTPEQAQQFAGGEMVHQRAHASPSGRRDPRLRHAPQELTAVIGNQREQ